MIDTFTELTWQEIQKKADSGAITVLVTGSTEQHGPHLPVKTDSYLVESVVTAACGLLNEDADGPDIIVAPTLWLGASDHHRPLFALSLSENTYIDAITDICSSIGQAGFGRLFIINGHGGNTSPLRVAIAGLRKSNPKLLVATADYWSLAAQGIREARRTEPGGAAHAGEVETSLIMHLDPSSVRTDLIERSVPTVPVGFEIDLIDGGPAALYTAWELLSEKGHLGDPTVSDAKQGESFFDAAVSSLVKTLKAFSKYSP